MQGQGIYLEIRGLKDATANFLCCNKHSVMNHYTKVLISWSSESNFGNSMSVSLNVKFVSEIRPVSY